MSYDKLIGRIAEKGLSQKAIARQIGISANSFTNKIKGRSEFSSFEIAKICEILDITTEEIGSYFFTIKV